MSRPGQFGMGVAAAIAAIMMWGAQLPVAKAAFEVLDPYTLTAIRYALASLVLVIILALREGPTAFSCGPRPLRLVVAGVLGMAGSPLLVFVGLLYTLPEHAVIIIALQPSLMAMLQWRLYGRRPPTFTIGAIAVAFAGVVLVVIGHGIRPGEAKLVGDLLVLSGVLCWISYTLMLGSFPGFGVLRFTTLSCFFGTLAICVAAAIALATGAASVPDTPALVAVTPHVLFLAIPGVVLALLLWNYGHARIGALNSMLLLNLMPIETYLIRYLQGARFTWQEWTGAAMVVGALVANSLYQRRAQAIAR